MESIIKTIQSIYNKKTDNDENKNKAIGEQIMLILLAETNIDTLRNPVKCFNKIVAKFVQKKELSHVLKYCRLVGLKPNANKYSVTKKVNLLKNWK